MLKDFNRATITHRLTSLFLAIWVAGAGCLLCCDVTASDRSTARFSVVESESAGISCEIACCKKKGRSHGGDKKRSRSCCPLAGLNAELPGQTPAPQLNLAYSDFGLQIPLVPVSYHEIVHHQSVLYDRGGTFLNNCALLI